MLNTGQYNTASAYLSQTIILWVYWAWLITGSAFNRDSNLTWTLKSDRGFVWSSHSNIFKRSANFSSGLVCSANQSMEPWTSKMTGSAWNLVKLSSQFLLKYALFIYYIIKKGSGFIVLYTIWDISLVDTALVSDPNFWVIIGLDNWGYWVNVYLSTTINLRGYSVDFKLPCKGKFITHRLVKSVTYQNDSNMWFGIVISLPPTIKQGSVKYSCGT